MSQCCAPTRGGSDRASRPAPAPSSGRTPRGALPVPGGTFAMGYDGPLANPGDGEGPVRQVAVDSFALGATPVTNQQFATFVKATGHVTTAEEEGWSFVVEHLVTDHRAVRGRPVGATWWCAVDGADWRHPYGPGSDAARLAQHPVVHVAAGDAEAYAAWVGGRLPTETEWEYAARGGLAGAIFPWGDEPPLAGVKRCNIWEGSFPDAPTKPVGTVPVKSYRPNGYGLLQMVGNVWEWTADPWRDATTGATDGRRVRRGGSYLCHDSYCNRYRVAARDASAPDDTTGNLGFRVAV